MLNIKHILFPVDFSERCCSAVPFVEAVASRYRAKITLLSVAQPFYFAAMGNPSGAVVIDTDELLRDLKERLDGSLRKAFGGLRVASVAELGDPAQAIAEFAHTHHVDLIMMPTHGYGPFRGVVLGSVTAKVLHDAACPVWTVAHVEEHPCRDHIACRNILCAVDGTPSSIALIRWAGEMAKDTGATLRLVHVIPGMGGFHAHHEVEMRKEARQAIEQLQEAAGVKAPICVAVGDVAERVQEEARRHGADRVVIGRGAIHETLGRLRTHAHGIIRQSPCPVLSL